MRSIEALAEHSMVRRAQDALAAPRHALLIAIIALGLMGVTTGVIARWYYEERTRQAQHQRDVGDRRATDGEIDAALDHYRAALALDRDNRVYRRAVALSLLRLQRFAEAERHLDELLEQNPVDAETNLLRARLAARRGFVENAEAYYQRAIYGRWPGDDEQAQRLAARFELVTWLEQIKATERAKAELVRLQAEVPDELLLQRQLARHFLRLGEPVQGVLILRTQMGRHPDDANVARELIAAALSGGRLEDARLAARRVVTLDPSDEASRRRLGQLTDALSLDPTRRRLSTAERVRRSGELLTRLVALIERCPAATGAPVSAEVADGMARARQLVDAKTTLATRNTIVEERIAVAESLWHEHGARCRDLDEPLAWVFDRLQQN